LSAAADIGMLTITSKRLVNRRSYGATSAHPL
jgi:hypothetical protein